MEMEEFKSAWQKHKIEETSLPPSFRISSSVPFLRTSAIRDLQRSDELSRLVFSLLFALVAIGASFLVLQPGAARIAAWLFALALLGDGLVGLVLLTHRFRQAATSTMLEFISQEYHQVETRLRYDRYSQWLMVMLAAVALVILFFAPRPVNLRESALDVLTRMAIVTAFLALAWGKARSRSKHFHLELERYLQDFDRDK